MKHFKSVALAMLAGGLILAGCGSDTSTSSGSAPSNSSTATPKGAAPAAAFENLTGVSTTVDLDPATAKVLTDNGVKVAPVAPATVD